MNYIIEYRKNGIIKKDGKKKLIIKEKRKNETPCKKDRNKKNGL